MRDLQKVKYRVVNQYDVVQFAEFCPRSMKRRKGNLHKLDPNAQSSCLKPDQYSWLGQAEGHRVRHDTFTLRCLTHTFH